jgi:hypothetical protein
MASADQQNSFPLNEGDVYRPKHNKDQAPFGGAELNWTSTRLDTFRSSERRRRNVRTRAINITLLRSEDLGLTSYSVIPICQSMKLKSKAVSRKAS